jgi:hypothetical protein
MKRDTPNYAILTKIHFGRSIIARDQNINFSRNSLIYGSGSQPFMLHVPPGNVYVTGVPLV